MLEDYVQEHLRATPWDSASAKTPGSGTGDVTVSVKDGLVTLVTATGNQLASGPVADVTVCKLIAGLKHTMAGVVLDFGEHRWMINFAPLLWGMQPKRTLKKAIRAFDPTSRFRDIKKCQVVRDEFLRTVERLGGHLAEPCT